MLEYAAEVGIITGPSGNLHWFDSLQIQRTDREGNKSSYMILCALVRAWPAGGHGGSRQVASTICLTQAVVSVSSHHQLQSGFWGLVTSRIDKVIPVLRPIRKSHL